MTSMLLSTEKSILRVVGNLSARKQGKQRYLAAPPKMTVTSIHNALSSKIIQSQLDICPNNRISMALFQQGVCSRVYYILGESQMT